MAQDKCVHCGRTIVGTVESIVPTLCCVHCCTRGEGERKDKSFGEYYSISDSHATNFFGCKLVELKRLNFTTRKLQPQVKLYLRAEVKYLTEIRKVKELEEKAGIQLKSVDPVLRHFLLGSYLQRETVEDSLEVVLKRCSVLDRVTEIVKTCKKAHPGAAFDFCLDNPESGPKEFQDLKDKMRLALHIERARIMSEVPEEYRWRLRNTALEDLYEDFMTHDWRSLVRRRSRRYITPLTTDNDHGLSCMTARLMLRRFRRIDG